MPSSGSYGKRFGGLLRAYALVGFHPDRDYDYVAINRELRRWRPEILDRICARLTELDVPVQRSADTDAIKVSGEWDASVVVVRSQAAPLGGLRWHVRLDTSMQPDITIAVRMNAGNDNPRDYYLVPGLDLADWPRRVEEENTGFIDSYRFDDLKVLDDLARRVRIGQEVL
jgi:hypothetical protein